eukprot:scaffold34197_cov70-Phaeocystis_antarctica.AAC.9
MDQQERSEGRRGQGRHREVWQDRRVAWPRLASAPTSQPWRCHPWPRRPSLLPHFNQPRSATVKCGKREARRGQGRHREVWQD